jgi:HicB family
MVVRKKNGPSRAVVAKARKVLEFAQERAARSADWLELSNALFGPGGKATELFEKETERTAFTRTEEYKQVLALLDTLPQPQIHGFVDMVASANGAISVRLPRSIHAALLVEAKMEGVSLNQLCVAKLVAQLRAVV